MSSDGWMLDGWAVRDEEPIHPTSAHPCIIGTAGIQGVKEGFNCITIIQWSLS